MTNLRQVLDWLAAAPPGTTIPADAVRAMLAPLADGLPAPAPAMPVTWRERLWIAPPETRLGMREVCEALDRSPAWVRRRLTTGGTEGQKIPHRKLDGELVFLAGELRGWLDRNEGIIERAPDVRPLRPRRSA